MGEGGVSGAGSTAAQGTAEARTGGGTPGERRDYIALIQTWLERHKEYPRRARLRRQEGTVVLRFVIDRQGAVLSHRIERGSGHSALDDEVEKMIRRASPLPAMPPGVAGETLEIAVPVVFALR
ncbi:periplasmic binding protein TonB [Caenispirillum salinarum AK4]|uniref:Periplasmic binding protein TonB n=1 Tax=Caenispirillum salinarum AK4 TaxID=1238182 RepID=K9HNP0_9PROT|nr:periplasmic binding protein TonB [Caenispirillum salinarum AK4]